MADETQSVELRIETGELERELEQIGLAAKQAAQKIDRSFSRVGSPTDLAKNFGLGADKAGILDDKLKSLQFETELLSQRFEGISKETFQEALNLGLLDRNLGILDANIAESIPGLVELDKAFKDLALTSEAFSFVVIDEEQSSKLEEIKTKLKELEAAGKITEDQFSSAIKRAEKQFSETNEFLEDLKKGGDKLGDSLEKAFEDAIEGTKEFDDILGDLRESLLEVARSVFITGPLKRAFGPFFSNLGDDLLGGIGNFLGVRASGGDVTGGKPFLVGERGPELFIPDASGVIQPSHRVRDRTDATINFNIDARGADRARIAQMEHALITHIKSTPSIAIAAVNNFNARRR